MASTLTPTTFKIRIIEEQSVRSNLIKNEVVYNQQLLATRTESVTAFLVGYWNGSIQLNPPTDTWFDEKAVTSTSYNEISTTVVHPDVQLVTRGGYSKKKNYKNQHIEIEQTIQKIIDGEPEPEIVEEVKPPEEIDFTPYISELIAEAQAEALNLSMQEYMRLEAEAEADDEETLLMIL